MRKNAYDRPVRKWLVRTLLAAVLAVVLGAVGLFGYTLTLRTLWKGDRTKLAEIINDAYHGRYCTLSSGGTETVATPKAVDFFYYNFLTSPDTVALSLAAVPETEKSIRLVMPQSTIVFTPVGDGAQTNVSWTQDGSKKAYTLRGVLPFSHLEQYFENNVYWNSLSALEREAAEAP